MEIQKEGSQNFEALVKSEVQKQLLVLQAAKGNYTGIRMPKDYLVDALMIFMWEAGGGRRG